MNSRPLVAMDYAALQVAMDKDPFHPGEWKVSHFEGQCAEVFEDLKGPVVYVLYTGHGETGLRISTVWNDSLDVHRNARAIVFLVRQTADRARQIGIKELVFSTTHAKLATFCSKVLGFTSKGGDEYGLLL